MSRGIPVMAFGEGYPSIVHAARAYGVVSSNAAADRVKRGWTVEDAITRPAGYVKDVSRRCPSCGEVAPMTPKAKRCKDCLEAEREARKSKGMTVKGICVQCGADTLGYKTRKYCDECRKKNNTHQKLLKHRETKRRQGMPASQYASITAICRAADRVGLSYGKYVALYGSAID